MLVSDLLVEETYDAYIQRLTKDLRIEKLGSGYYAKVFQHPTHPDVAVKILKNNDPEYIKYVKIIRKRQKNPWFPKIIGLEKVRFDSSYKSGKSKGYVIFFERLSKITKKEYDSLSNFFINELEKYKEAGPIIDLYDLRLSDWKIIAKNSNDPNISELAKVLVKVGAKDIHNQKTPSAAQKNLPFPLELHLPARLERQRCEEGYPVP